MSDLSFWEGALLVGGGMAAGTINSIAGGGSLLTVPLLVVAGVPGTIANGSNRVGVVLSNVTASAQFRRLGVGDVKQVVPVLIPVIVGSLLGAIVVGRLDDDAFEQIFGFLMVPLLILSLRKPKPPPDGVPRTWPPWLAALIFFAIGVYGGAFQAGIGLILIVALARSGMDLVTANAIKVVVILVVTATALPVFIINGQVDWPPALILGAGFAVGGAVGANLTVAGGERLIRPVMIVAVLALAGELLGLY